MFDVGEPADLTRFTVDETMLHVANHGDVLRELLLLCRLNRHPCVTICRAGVPVRRLWAGSGHMEELRVIRPTQAISSV